MFIINRRIITARRRVTYAFYSFYSVCYKYKNLLLMNKVHKKTTLAISRSVNR